MLDWTVHPGGDVLSSRTSFLHASDLKYLNQEQRRTEYLSILPARKKIEVRTLRNTKSLARFLYLLASTISCECIFVRLHVSLCILLPLCFKLGFLDSLYSLDFFFLVVYTKWVACETIEMSNKKLRMQTLPPRCFLNGAIEQQRFYRTKQNMIILQSAPRFYDITRIFRQHISSDQLYNSRQETQLLSLRSKPSKATNPRSVMFSTIKRTLRVAW